MLDLLPAPARHLAFALIAVLLAWGSTDLVPLLNGQPGWGALAGALCTSLIAYLTPLLTRQYGVGSPQGI